MGLSSSQIRFLTLTSRLHDIEFKAQNVMESKLRLATERDDAYKTYCDALDAKAYKVKYIDGTLNNLIDANYNSLCTYSRNRVDNYALVDNKTGKIFVDNFTGDTYDKYGYNKYAFAFAMMGLTPDDGIISQIDNPTTITEERVVSGSSGNADHTGEEKIPGVNGEWNAITTPVIGETHTYYVGSISAKFKLHKFNASRVEIDKKGNLDLSKYIELSKSYNIEDKMTSKEDCVNDYKKYVSEKFNYNPWDDYYLRIMGCDHYECIDESMKIDLTTTTVKDSDTSVTDEYGEWIWYDNAPNESEQVTVIRNTQTTIKSIEDIFNELAELNGKNNLEFSSSEFDFYCQKWEAIQGAYGYTKVPPDSLQGTTGTEWFKKNVESGRISILVYGQTSNGDEWSTTSFATSTSYNNLQEVSDDTDVAKAEAEYEYVLGLINAKDTRFDQDLAKLETEKSATEKEMESIEKTKQDNIDKTFDIFN